MENEAQKKGWEGGWAVLEVMGHRRMAGKVSEVNFAGSVLLRVDVPVKSEGPGLVEEKWATQFYGGAADLPLSPVSEEMARAVAAHAKPEPVHAWEMPKPALTAGRPTEESPAAELEPIEEEDLEDTPAPAPAPEVVSPSPVSPPPNDIPF